MNRRDPAAPVAPPFEPKHPTLLAVLLCSIWIAVLSLPMLAGRFLSNPYNDQLTAGVGYRTWGAEQWKALGHVPLWNPEIFAGLPFVGAMHGDIFYPTAWLRLFLPTTLVMNWQFPVHYVLAGLFIYLLLRLYKTTWAGAVTGALAYEMSGVILSYVSPGHDGKLFVTALLPLALIGLVLGMRDRKYQGFGIVALAVGLAILSPQSQMTYYMLVASGVFALYLALGGGDSRPRHQRLASLGLAAMAVAVGAGISMIQTIPFLNYIPHSPRADQGGGFDWATTFAIPWHHVPEFFLSNFVGKTARADLRDAATYWGLNGIKLHSEYLGLPVIALAILGVQAKERRRLVYWLGGIGALFLLVGMGSATPFYRVWWSVMPFMDKVRAPGMALYIVCLVVAMFAAFGVERLERREAPRAAIVWMVAGGVVAVLALAGAFGGLAESLAIPQRASVAQAAQSSIMIGALGSGAALLVAGLVLWGWARGKVTPAAFAFLVAGVVSADLWRAGRPFWLYTDAPEKTIYAPNAITEYLQQQPKPYRVVDFALGGAELMAFGIPQLKGHHGFELHAFNELLGGQFQWDGMRSPRMWDIFAAKFILVHHSGDSVPGYRRIQRAVPSTTGPLDLYESNTPARYGRLVPAAIKLPDSTAKGALYDPRFSPDGLVLLDTAAPVNPAPITTIPPPLNVAVTFPEWIPGRMTARLEPAAPQDGYLVVSENYYPDWKATVDGRPATVLRGNVTLLTVPVPAGAREVQLAFDSADYRTGKAITLICAALALLATIVPPIVRRRTGA